MNDIALSFYVHFCSSLIIRVFVQQYFLDVVEICEDAGIGWSTISKSRGTIHIDRCSHPDDSKNLHNDSPNTPRVGLDYIKGTEQDTAVSIFRVCK